MIDGEIVIGQKVRLARVNIHHGARIRSMVGRIGTVELYRDEGKITAEAFVRFPKLYTVTGGIWLRPCYLDPAEGER